MPEVWEAVGWEEIIWDKPPPPPPPRGAVGGFAKEKHSLIN